MFTFLSSLRFSTSVTTYELNQGGWDGCIEEAIEVEVRMFGSGRRTEGAKVVAKMTPILATFTLISYILPLGACLTVSDAC